MALIGLGIVLLFTAYFLSRKNDPGSSPSQPGALRASRSKLQWQSPNPEVGLPSSGHTPTFDLVNIGGSPVRIQSVGTTCGCATARAEPEVDPSVSSPPPMAP